MSGEEYRPYVFSDDCELSDLERDCIESQRRDLWKNGITKQPMLDRMAFEFGYVLCLFKGGGADDEQGKGG